MNPCATVLFTVCTAVTVECCVLYPCCMGVFGMFAVIEGRRLFSSVFAITEMRDMGLYEVVKISFDMLVRNAIPRGSMSFRCLMFNLSGHCELLFLLCFIAYWT